MKHQNDEAVEVAGVCGLDEYFVEPPAGSDISVSPCVPCDQDPAQDPPTPFAVHLQQPTCQSCADVYPYR